MSLRTSGALAALLLALGSAGGPAQAQYYPLPQAYPQPAPAQGGYRPPPPVDEGQPYDYSILPPLDVGAPAAEPPAGSTFRRRAPAVVEEQALPPPSPGQPLYREPRPAGAQDLPPAYPQQPYPQQQAHPGPQYPRQPYPQQQAHPGPQYPQPAYPAQSQHPQSGLPQHQATAPAGHGQPMPQGFEPAAAGTRPYHGGSPPAMQPGDDGVRPPMPIGQHEHAPTGTVRGDTRMAALPPEVRPETGPRKELPPQFRRTLVDYRTKEPPGTIIIDTANTYLYLVLPNGKAMRYGVGVGREGFTWSGAEKVTRMAEWPDWNPPAEMIERQPYLPRFMAGGDGNPMGARALYLGKTIYRIHGTNQPSTIGSFVSSGCIRLTNEDVTDLYSRVKVGTRVVVLPGSPSSATASAAPLSPPMSVAPPPPQAYPPQAYPPQAYPPAPGYPPASQSYRPLPPPPFAVPR
jgi:lipoprotein-anchoring transpeptidase ErfK/SrfK